MSTNGRKLITRNHLMRQYDGYKYECRKGNGGAALSRIKMNVVLFPWKGNYTCQCLNGGKCLNDNDCMCLKNTGRLHERSGVEKQEGEMNQLWQKRFVFLGGLVVIFIIIIHLLSPLQNIIQNLMNSKAK